MSVSLPANQLSDTHHDARRFLRRLTAATTGGEFIDGYVLGGIGSALPFVVSDLKVSTVWQGLIGASALIGIFVGGPIFGWLTDRFGRRLMFTIDMVLFLVGSILQLFVGNAWELFAVRLLMGLAIGAEYAIGAPLLSEYAPAKARGKLLASLEVTWYLGYILGFGVGAAFVGAGPDSWRWILGSSTIPAIICLILRNGTPESVRWLLSKGRRPEAQALVDRYHLDIDLDEAAAEIAPRKPGFGALFSRDHRRATIFTSVFWSALVLPYFAIFTFSPEVLSALGIRNDVAGSLANDGIAVLGVLVGTLVVDRIGRRKLLIPPFWITAVAMLVIGIWPHGPVFLIVLCFVVFSFFNAASSALTAVYPMEVFPTSIRTTGVGFSAAMSRVGAAIGTFLLPLALDHIGVGPSMLIAAAVLAIGGAVSQFLGPETNGLTLTQSVRSTVAPAD